MAPKGGTISNVELPQSPASFQQERLVPPLFGKISSDFVFRS
jgi:hypothetical protein